MSVTTNTSVLSNRALLNHYLIVGTHPSIRRREQESPVEDTYWDKMAERMAERQRDGKALLHETPVQPICY